MDEFINKIGSELVENSQYAEEFSAQRGLINELFPYVYEASRRMSSRAISRWLADKGVKLSAATIAKALRNETEYWQELADEIEPAARLFSTAYGLDIQEALECQEIVESRATLEKPMIARTTGEGVFESLDDVAEARSKLSQWFDLPDAAREACLASAEFGFESEESVVKQVEEKKA
jgi:hypothetical protein